MLWLSLLECDYIGQVYPERLGSSGGLVGSTLFGWQGSFAHWLPLLLLQGPPGGCVLLAIGAPASGVFCHGW